MAEGEGENDCRPAPGKPETARIYRTEGEDFITQASTSARRKGPRGVS